MSLYWEGGALSATATKGTKTLGEACTSLLVYNRDTTNEVFINLNSATVTASTSYFRLAPGKSVTIEVDHSSSGITSFSYICDTGETATVDYAAMRGARCW